MVRRPRLQKNVSRRCSNGRDIEHAGEETCTVQEQVVQVEVTGAGIRLVRELTSGL